MTVAKTNAALLQAGKTLGRQGLSERVIKLVDEFSGTDNSYKGAIALAGRLHAIYIACRFDGYWEEKSRDGFYTELGYLTSVTEKEPTQ